MARTSNCAPNIPSTTGNPSGGGRGNCSSSGKQMNNSKKCMTKTDVRRIQSKTAKQNNGQISKGSFVARAMSAVDKGTCSLEQKSR